MAEIIWDSELGPAWPSDWSHTRVDAQFVAVTGDGADSNRLPDIAPSGNGEVIFTPSLRTVRYVGADGPYVVSLKQYRAVVDSEGYLCTPDQYGQPGERGIVLPSTDAEVLEPRGEDDNAFTWRVDFDLPAVTIRSDHIAVPVGGPYDLVDLLSPERAAGVVHIIDRVSAREAIEAASDAEAARDLVLPARDQTLAARDETLQHGITVDTSVGTRVYVGETMIYGDTGWRDVTTSVPNVSSGRIYLRRLTQNVTMLFDDVVIDGLQDSWAQLDGFLPVGWRPELAGFMYIPTAARNASYSAGPVRVRNTGQLIIYDARNKTIALMATWPVSQAWSTTEPGTPA